MYVYVAEIVEMAMKLEPKWPRAWSLNCYGAEMAMGLKWSRAGAKTAMGPKQLCG